MNTDQPRNGTVIVSGPNAEPAYEVGGDPTNADEADNSPQGHGTTHTSFHCNGCCRRTE